MTLPTLSGRRRDVLLGKYGSAESRINYQRIISEWEANGRIYVEKSSPHDTTISELLIQFWKHALIHYRRADGSPTEEIEGYRLSLRPLRLFYGKIFVKEFGPLALKVIRQKMIDGYEHPKYGKQAPLSRKVINQRIGRIRRVFKWGVENELVPVTVFTALLTVKGLQAGRTKAIEHKKVKSVPLVTVKQTLPFLNRQLAGMVRLQYRTAARPGEICRMRGCDIDASGKIWVYKPIQHKTVHLGDERRITIGPRAKRILRHFIKRDPEDFLFSPADARFEWVVAARAKRKSKVQPSQKCRKKSKPKKVPGQHYTVASYGKAIAQVCRKHGIPHWHPHQLRHTRATELRKKYGLDVARAILGHRTPNTTEIYAEIDITKATSVMRKIG